MTWHNDKEEAVKCLQNARDWLQGVADDTSEERFVWFASDCDDLIANIDDVSYVLEQKEQTNDSKK